MLLPLPARQTATDRNPAVGRATIPGMKTSKKIPLRCAAALLTATLFSNLTAAETEALPNSPSPAIETRANELSALSHSDRSFLEKAAKSGMKEVDVSKAVEPRLVDPQVKSFAQMMVADHTAANSELVALAARKGVSLPSDNLKVIEKWSKNNKDVDDEYVEEMKDDHEEAVKLFEKASKSDDADIAAFARKTLPSLQNHLAMVKQLKKTVK